MQIRLRRWQVVIGILAAGIVALVLLWNWDWFIPISERMASTQLGRPVHIAHLHLRIARNPVLEVDGLVIDNPPDFPAPGPFARVDRLAVTLDGPAYLHGQVLVIPSIEVDKPQVEAAALPDGRNNWTFPFGGGAPSGTTSSPSPKFGDLRIVDGHLHAVVPKERADFNLGIATAEPADGKPSQLLVQIKGTYANQPITGQFAGGALLTLRDVTNPYPIDVELHNGATHVALHGTVQDPLAFAGTNLKLRFEGANLADLLPLTGIATPSTPSYQLTGDLAYADRKIRFQHFEGRVGSTDLEGDIAVDPGTERPQVTATLTSRNVDLADLGGAVGATPGRRETANATPQQRAAVARAEASPKLIPNTPLSLPKLRAADVELHYKGDKIEGRSVPLDSLAIDLSIKDGAVRMHPVSFAVGRGRINANIALDEQSERALHAHANVEFRQVDVGRLLSATHAFGGAGTLGGSAEIEGTGASLSGLLGTGNGELKLFMVGGDLSALLLDLSGLEFGNALLSALGVPKRTQVRCLVSDFALRKGVLDTRTLLLDTAEANMTGKGNVNLREETVDYQIRTEAKHFTIGSLPADINISGHLKSPSILPDAKELAVRGGLAVGLGVLLTPLGALLPTIQFGLGEDNNCGQLIRNAEHTPNPAKQPSSTRRQRSATRTHRQAPFFKDAQSGG